MLIIIIIIIMVHHCVLFSCVKNFHCVVVVRFKVNMSSYPIISRIHGALNELEAFQQSHPLNQPDCPPELKDKK